MPAVFPIIIRNPAALSLYTRPQYSIHHPARPQMVLFNMTGFLDFFLNLQDHLDDFTKLGIIAVSVMPMVVGIIRAKLKPVVAPANP
jgi:hypothetical protein